MDSSQQDNQEIPQLQVGQRWKSFAEFKEIYLKYCIYHNINFNIISSEYISNNSPVKYSDIHYRCHEYDRRGCTAHIHVKAIEGNNLAIVAFQSSHNHPWGEFATELAELEQQILSISLNLDPARRIEFLNHIDQVCNKYRNQNQNS